MAQTPVEAPSAGRNHRGEAVARPVVRARPVVVAPTPIEARSGGRNPPGGYGAAGCKSPAPGSSLTAVEARSGGRNHRGEAVARPVVRARPVIVAPTAIEARSGGRNPPGGYGAAGCKSPAPGSSLPAVEARSGGRNHRGEAVARPAVGA